MSKIIKYYKVNKGLKNSKIKWTQPVHNWSLTISPLAIYFEGRLDDYLDL